MTNSKTVLIISTLDTKREETRYLKYKFEEINTSKERSTITNIIIEGATKIARKLNGTKAPVKFIIPMQGWSSVDTKGNPTFNPEEDRIFVETLKGKLDANIEIPETGRRNGLV